MRGAFVCESALGVGLGVGFRHGSSFQLHSVKLLQLLSMKLLLLSELLLVGGCAGVGVGVGGAERHHEVRLGLRARRPQARIRTNRHTRVAEENTRIENNNNNEQE